MVWQDYETEWEENPDLLLSWGINEEFHAMFDRGFRVRSVDLNGVQGGGGGEV